MNHQAPSVARGLFSRLLERLAARAEDYGFQLPSPPEDLIPQMLRLQKNTLPGDFWSPGSAGRKSRGRLKWGGTIDTPSGKRYAVERFLDHLKRGDRIRSSLI